MIRNSGASASSPRRKRASGRNPARVHLPGALVKGGDGQAEAGVGEALPPERQHRQQEREPASAAGQVRAQPQPDIERRGIGVVAARHPGVRAEAAETDQRARLVARREISVRRIDQDRHRRGEVGRLRVVGRIRPLVAPGEDRARVARVQRSEGQLLHRLLSGAWWASDGPAAPTQRRPCRARGHTSVATIHPSHHPRRMNGHRPAQRPML